MTPAAVLQEEGRATGTPVEVGPTAYAWILLPATAVVVSLLSLRSVDVDDLGPWGLVVELPWSWYVGLSALLLGLGVLCQARSASAGLLVAHLSGLVLVLYGTAPLVDPTARYYWAFKHVGVARYILENEAVDRSVDIYHRWPGFFALVAALSRGTGVDPLDLARGSEIFFGALNAVLMVALVRVLGGGLQQAVLTSGLFSVCNWVGQGYFAPQALAFSLGLGMVIVVVSRLSGPPSRPGRVLEGVLRRVVRRRSGSTAQARQPAAQGATVAAVLVLHTAIVVTHQLTPYLLVLSLSVATFFGYVRPRRPVLALGFLTGAYLLPQLGYLLESQSLFGGFNPVENAAVTYSHAPLLPEKLARDKATTLLTLLPWLLAFGGVLRRARSDISQAVLVGLLAFSPLLLLLVQSYGGEARLRVILFSLPWLCVAASWLLMPVERWRAVMAGATSVLLVLLTGLFVVSFLGNEDLNAVRPAEVAASEWIYARDLPDYVVVLGAPGFPLRVSARYDRAAGPTGDSTPSVAEQVGLRPGDRRPDVIADRIEAYARAQARDGFVVFSTNQFRYARTYDLALPVPLAEIEDAVASSSSFRLVFENSDVRVYRMRPRSAPKAAS